MLSTAHGVIPTHSSVCCSNTSSLTAWTPTVVFVVVQVVAHTAYPLYSEHYASTESTAYDVGERDSQATLGIVVLGNFAQVR